MDDVGGSDFPVREALYIFPLDWQRNRISDGLFTVESDRADVVKLGEMALSSKIQHLRQRGLLSHYRFYLACRPRPGKLPKLPTYGRQQLWLYNCGV